MKRVCKRFLALLCMFAMLVGTIWIGDYEAAEASGTSYEGTVVENWLLTSTQNRKEYDSITLDTNAATTDYRLHIRMYIPQSVYDTISSQKLHIELCLDKEDNYEFDFMRTDFKAGENEWVLTWEDAEEHNGAKWGQSINFIRIYAGSAANSLSGVFVREMKVVRMTEREWNIFAEKAMNNTGNTGSVALDSSITFGSDDTEENLMVCVELNVSSDWWSNYKDREGGNNMHIELLPTSAIDEQEYQVTIPITQAGVNSRKILLSDVKKTNNPSVSNTLQYYRIVMNNGGNTMSGITITSMYIVDTTPHVEEHQSSVWTLVDDTISSKGVFDKQDIGFMSTVRKDNMALQLSLDVPETVYDEITDHSLWRVKIAHSNSGDGNAVFSPENTTSGILNITKAGLNQFVLYGYHTTLINNTAINRCRVWHNGGKTDLTGVKVTLKVIDLNEEYVAAGSTPTELGADVSRVPEGYSFAGWYTDEACTTTSVLEGDASGIVYAKYVREGVQGVQAQATEDSENTTTKAAIRFITTVDSVNYQKAGFDITINGKTLSKESTIVYSELYAVGADSGEIKYVPTDIDPASMYFNTFTIENIPEDGYEKDITVQSYWITQDGTKVLGEQKAYTVAGVLAE